MQFMQEELHTHTQADTLTDTSRDTVTLTDTLTIQTTGVAAHGVTNRPRYTPRHT